MHSWRMISKLWGWSQWLSNINWNWASRRSSLPWGNGSWNNRLRIWICRCVRWMRKYADLGHAESNKVLIALCVVMGKLLLIFNLFYTNHRKITLTASISKNSLQEEYRTQPRNYNHLSKSMKSFTSNVEYWLSRFAVSIPIWINMKDSEIKWGICYKRNKSNGVKRKWIINS